ncbi:glutathione S-transferase family protein [Cylindrospermopsis raciborskii CHAB3438]|uniref:glutathione S-transferase family protein n=1 Tax=Cylindrospermopsis raciborskii TaxID=77022 RepID=UPI001F106587|nr:glutathione S-transferase family protein [Cylindrospermopsis raciborskii]MCH4903771.1 glutathione S-transferase family protein [Cylindrospermopsis raciborskii CHAB3438]MEB3146755.1 glutathione S-transferase family protein [Cylindrospermopsis raciborskii]
MLKLYGSLFSRASIIKWYLEELNVPYEFVNLDMKAGDHLKPDFLAINPIGKVPAIVDGELKLWESGAILLYLAQKYSQVSSSLETQATFYQWVLFANSTLATGIFIETNREKEMPRLLGTLNDIFSQQPFLLGDQFTVADVAVGSILSYIPIMLKLDLSNYPAVLNYMHNISLRPAFQNTIGARSN